LKPAFTTSLGSYFPLSVRIRKLPVHLLQKQKMKVKRRVKQEISGQNPKYCIIPTTSYSIIYCARSFETSKRFHFSWRIDQTRL